MTPLTNAIQPQPAQPPPPPPKPRLDFQGMVKDATKGKNRTRGGLSSAVIIMIQSVYAQEIAQAGKSAPGEAPPGLEPGWGGQGR